LFLVSQLSLFVQNLCRHAQKLTILKFKILWGGDTPSPDPTSLRAYGASIFAPTALKLNVTTIEKNPSYGLGLTAL